MYYEYYKKRKRRYTCACFEDHNIGAQMSVIWLDSRSEAAPPPQGLYLQTLFACSRIRINPHVLGGLD
jgi:hypothetical protein